MANPLKIEPLTYKSGFGAPQKRWPLLLACVCLVAGLLLPELDFGPRQYLPFLFYGGLFYLLVAYARGIVGLAAIPSAGPAVGLGAGYRYYALAVFAAVGAYLVYHSSLEKFIPFWDWCQYWKYCIVYMEKLWTSPQGAIRWIYTSIETEEYNQFPCFLLAPALRIFSVNFTGYLLSIYLLFYVPAAWLFASVLRRIGRDLAAETAQKDGLAHAKLATLADFLAPVFSIGLPVIFLPMLNGMLDSVGLLFAVVLLAASYGQSPWTWRGRKVLALVPLLVFMAFTRRWYAIGIVAFLLSYGVVGFLALAFRQAATVRDRLVALIGLGLRLAALGGLMGLVWKLGFPQFFHRSLFNQYADQYKSYQYGGWGYSLSVGYGHLGPFFFGLGLLGFGYLIYRKSQLRWFALALVFQIVLCFIITVRINNFAWTHYHLLMLPLLALAFCGAMVLCRFLPRLGPYVVLALLGANWLSVLATRPVALPAWAYSVVSGTQFPPKRRTDMPAFQAMHEYLERLCDDGRYKYYMLASSFNLNEEMMQSLNLPEQLNSSRGLAPLHAQVDVRDRFPITFPGADYVVIALPVQYHLQPDGQKIVGWLAEAVLDTNGIGRHYQYLRSFALQDGIEVRIYKKTSGWSKAETDGLVARFKGAYPAYDYMWRIPPSHAASFARHTPPAYGQMDLLEYEHVLYAHPGATEASSISFNIEGHTGTFRCQPKFRQACADGSETGLTILLDEQVAYQQSLNANSPIAPISLPLSGHKTLELQLDKGLKTDACDGMDLEEFYVW